MPVLTGRVDIANARLRFANGCIANLTASRISRDRVRKIRFFQPAAYLSIDYAAQKVEVLAAGRRRRRPMPSIQGGELDVDERGAAASASSPTSSTPIARARAARDRRSRAAARSRSRRQITDKMATDMRARTTTDTKSRAFVTLSSACTQTSTTSSPTSTSGGCWRASPSR